MTLSMGATEGHQTQVRPAESAADHEAAAEALALAFAADPCWAHLLPDDGSRAEKLLAYFTSEIETPGPWSPPGLGDRGRWWRGDLGAAGPLAGAARSDPARGGPDDSASSAAACRSACGRCCGSNATTRSAPEHWYLHYLGVEPRRQGRGLGGALLRPVLELCDRERIPAHLEASTERNRMLYERNGFSLTEVFDMPGRGGPPIREMWRDPA